MLRGICKLCHKDADLQLSHLVGRAVYAQCRRDDENDPVLMTSAVVMKTSRQVRNHLLCRGCEDLFNKRGERYVTPLLWQKNIGFPLRDRLRLAFPIERAPTYEVFSGIQVGIDTDQLAYYAVSLVWRSAVHQWKTIGSQTTSVPLAVEAEECIRQYLLGKTGFPLGVGVAINVCTDQTSQYLVFPPSRSADVGGFSIYPFVVRGIDFSVLIATVPNLDFSEFCCVRSPAKKIFVSDKNEVRLNEVRHFFEESKIAQNVLPTS